MLFEAPASLDDMGAAAIFFPFHLAYLSLHGQARLQSGETLAGEGITLDPGVRGFSRGASSEGLLADFREMSPLAPQS